MNGVVMMMYGREFISFGYRTLYLGGGAGERITCLSSREPFTRVN